MSDDPPPGIVEVLDEWDDDERPARPTRRAWWIGPLAIVAIVAVVVAVVIGGTKRPEVDPVPSLSVTPSATVTSADPRPTSWATVEATIAIEVPDTNAYTPEPLPDDAEAEPLLITLLDPTPRVATGSVAYNVRVCVSKTSASKTGGKVRVSRMGWWLGGTRDSVQPQPGGGAQDFPEVAMLGAGQCASGAVTFLVGAGQTYSAIFYGDERFGWSWRFE